MWLAPWLPSGSWAPAADAFLPAFQAAAGELLAHHLTLPTLPTLPSTPPALPPCPAGAFDVPEEAAHAHDIGALCSGKARPDSLNFPLSDYEQLLPLLSSLPHVSGPLRMLPICLPLLLPLQAPRHT